VENIVVQYVEAGNFWDGPHTLKLRRLVPFCF